MKKILVVDDDPAILEVIKLILEENKYEVMTSQNGSVFKSLTNIPDLILLDVLLSGEDGREIAQKLKSDSKTDSIPIVMISAHPSANSTAILSGADDFVSKPFDIDNLLAVIERNIAQ